MKLYNRTSCPDEILRPLLTAAGIAAGARTGGVCVKVTRSLRVSGTAMSCSFVRRGWLDGGKGRSWIATDGGRILMRLPSPGHGDALAVAERFFTVAIHEWVHVRDYQTGKPFGQYNRRWANRPHERRAVACTADVLDAIADGAKKSRDNEILALALWLSSPKGPKP